MATPTPVGNPQNGQRTIIYNLTTTADDSFDVPFGQVHNVIVTENQDEASLSKYSWTAVRNGINSTVTLVSSAPGADVVIEVKGV